MEREKVGAGEEREREGGASSRWLSDCDKTRGGKMAWRGREMKGKEKVKRGEVKWERISRKMEELEGREGRKRERGEEEEEEGLLLWDRGVRRRGKAGVSLIAWITGVKLQSLLQWRDEEGGEKGGGIRPSREWGDQGLTSVCTNGCSSFQSDRQTDTHLRLWD